MQQDDKGLQHDSVDMSLPWRQFGCHTGRPEDEQSHAFLKVRLRGREDWLVANEGTDKLHTR